MTNTILLVEDDRDYNHYIKDMLEDEKYFVVSYNDGRNVLEELNLGLKYQLMITDLSLPGCDGDEILTLSKFLNPSIPVITISGYNFAPSGSNHHLLKPFKRSKLLDIVNYYFKVK